MELCVALDMPTFESNMKLANTLKKWNIWLKVGLRSYIRDGKKIVSEIKNINPNFKVFLDLKIYDIPNTMADAAESMANLGVDMFNVHASSGRVAMREVMDRVSTLKKPPLVLAVTALTSFDEKNFELIYKDNIDKKVNQFAKDAYECGLNGVVCSVLESKMIKSNIDKNFKTITPGIRMKSGNDDQKRVATVEFAKEQNSDIIVVGRPIYNSPNPLKVVEEIIKRMK